jgi:predicted TIM-barrel fold metal-dependent hydrolase
MATQTVSAAASQLEIKPDWLARHVEEIVEPNRPIVDPHHHLWDTAGRRYLFDELVADVRTGHNVKATVFVQCHSMYRADGPEEMKPVGETEFVVGAAAQSASGAYGPAKLCAGIVGSLDMMLGDRSTPVLEAHIQAGNGRFRGIRGRTSYHESKDVQTLPTPAGVLKETAARKTISCIEKLGLSLDVWCFHTQLAEVIDVCKAFPNLPIVVDHVGGPLGIGPHKDKREEVYAIWIEHIRALSKIPNVFLKIGGLGMRFTGYEFHKQASPPSSDELVKAWKPYVQPCIDAFGPARCMFESNFPVDKAMFSYPVMWNAFKKLAAGYSESEKDSLCFGAAAKFYKLSL